MLEYDQSDQAEMPDVSGFSVKIIGVGGAGANVLDRMALEGTEDADMLTLNTDVRALSTSVSNNKIQLGKELLKGMGAGGDPELGRQAALEVEDQIRSAIKGHAMVFVCAGLGGGTGSGAAPEVCRIAKQEGVFLVAFTTLPFSFEGARRMQQAKDALDRIAEHANAVVTFENDRMGSLIVPKDGIQSAFTAADKTISESVRATTNIVTQPGIIRIGMDDLLSALRNRDSRCLFGHGQAKGDNRAQEALKQALKSPLIDKGKLLEQTRNVLVHIAGGDTLTLFEVELLMQELNKHVGENTQIMFGVGSDKKLGASLAVTIISSLSEGAVEAEPDTEPQGVETEEVSQEEAAEEDSEKKKIATADDEAQSTGETGTGTETGAEVEGGAVALLGGVPGDPDGDFEAPSEDLGEAAPAETAGEQSDPEPQGEAEEPAQADAAASEEPPIEQVDGDSPAEDGDAAEQAVAEAAEAQVEEPVEEAPEIEPEADAEAAPEAMADETVAEAVEESEEEAVEAPAEEPASEASDEAAAEIPEEAESAEAATETAGDLAAEDTSEEVTDEGDNESVEQQPSTEEEAPPVSRVEEPPAELLSSIAVPEEEPEAVVEPVVDESDREPVAESDESPAAVSAEDSSPSDSAASEAVADESPDDQSGEEPIDASEAEPSSGDDDSQAGPTLGAGGLSWSGLRTTGTIGAMLREGRVDPEAKGEADETSSDENAEEAAAATPLAGIESPFEIGDIESESEPVAEVESAEAEAETEIKKPILPGAVVPEGEPEAKSTLGDLPPWMTAKPDDAASDDAPALSDDESAGATGEERDDTMPISFLDMAKRSTEDAGATKLSSDFQFVEPGAEQDAEPKAGQAESKPPAEAEADVTADPGADAASLDELAADSQDVVVSGKGSGPAIRLTRITDAPEARTETTPIAPLDSLDPEGDGEPTDPAAIEVEPSPAVTPVAVSPIAPPPGLLPADDSKPAAPKPRGDQAMLDLEPSSKGRFAKSEPTIVDGQDLDVPTLLRTNRKS